jgi:hypothetical protein
MKLFLVEGKSMPEPAMLVEFVAVVRGDDDDGIFESIEPAESLDKQADLLVRVADSPVIIVDLGLADMRETVWKRRG